MEIRSGGITEDNELMTVAQAAQMLHLHPRTIRNRIRNHVLPAQKLAGGKAMLIAKRDILALLKNAHEEDRQGSAVVSRLHTAEGRESALAVLRSFDQDDTQEQRETGAYLLDALDEDRLSKRPHFPQGRKH